MWFSMSYFNLIEVSIGCQVWISFSPFDTHERKLSAPYSVSQGAERWGAGTYWDPVCLQCGRKGPEMAFIAKTFYDLRATTLEGDSVDFNVYRGRVVLIENVASLWGTTTRDFSQLNQLQSKYPHRLVVLGFPCNQFGHQVCWAARLKKNKTEIPNNSEYVVLIRHQIKWFTNDTFI